MSQSLNFWTMLFFHSLPQLPRFNHLQDVFDLPSDLFDGLLMQLSPLALEKLQAALSVNDTCGSAVNGMGDGRNVEGNLIACLFTEVVYDDLNRAWELLFKLRWPENNKKILQISHVRVQDRMESLENKHSTDWQQRYWESHLQECLDEASEKALLPAFDGCIKEIKASS
ncbi:unnamed protein product [Spirodela intermedia]|uniref:Uncharacterized protein n=1 Tax=Spirodela intermedia TaxID=51605 RepID=A0A7I8JT70_SPIIN|nr:unnamed protein product [Spirodela intermedia]CAA6673309.1 unnamed protein product [Spirodela intermedia]